LAIKQAKTIRTDLQVQGNKTFSDWAWKTRKVTGLLRRESTGLGVYCQIQQDNLKATILLKASAGRTPSPLHSKALALLLALKLTQQIHVHQVTFLTDIRTLARASVAASSSDTLVRNQRYGCKMQERIEGIASRIYHVKRKISRVAYNCAHQDSGNQTISVCAYL
jgi:hypothetical protein